jgi:hypothetical protein
MIPQLAVFEFRMYFLPGFLCVLTVAAVCIVMGSVDIPYDKLGDITESLIFLFMTYLTGQVVQTIAMGFKIRKTYLSITKPIEYCYWSSSIPSKLALVKNTALINNIQRLQIIKAALADNVLTQEEAKRLEENENENSLSHRVFYTKLKTCSDKHDSGVKNSESLYQMFRGFYCVASLSSIVSVLFLFARLINLKWPFYDDVFSWQAHLWWLFISILCLFLFAYRFRGLAEGFVKEVLYTYLNDKAK